MVLGMSFAMPMGMGFDGARGPFFMLGLMVIMAVVGIVTGALVLVARSSFDAVPPKRSVGAPPSSSRAP